MYSRREFMNLTAGSWLAGTLSPITASADIKAQPGYELIILATNWGFSGSYGEFCKKAKGAGYDGVEVWFPSNSKDRDDCLNAVKDNSLKIGFMLGGSDSDVKKHFQQFKDSLELAVALRPLYINCHSGRDHFSFDDNRAFMDLTREVGQRSQVPIYHETHRSRILYSAPVAKQFMEKISDLRLTLDVSHWCNVHESLLEDQQETLAMTLSRTDHIHARIGHPEGPQVNDPRAPEWKKSVDTHYAWWDKIVETKKKEGKRITILTEFGPVDYMPALPYTRQPVANQWEINAFMLETLRKRYA